MWGMQNSCTDTLSCEWLRAGLEIKKVGMPCFEKNLENLSTHVVWEPEVNSDIFLFHVSTFQNLSVDTIEILGKMK